jgi:hypothetical protein
MGCLKLRFKGDNNARLGLETTPTGVLNSDELTLFQHVNGLVKKKFPIHDVIDEALQVKFHCGRRDVDSLNCLQKTKWRFSFLR